MRPKYFLNILLVITYFAALLFIVSHADAQETATPIPVVVTVILVWPTATDTPVPTEGPSPTPTATETATPDFWAEATVEVDGIGQDVAFAYTVDAGQTAIFLVLVFIAIILLFGLLVFVRGG